MNNPTLSVLMTNYNHAKYVGTALEAIINQSCKPSEIIVIDDASTDNSVEVIQQFAKFDKVVRLIINEKNMGVVYNYNKLLGLAKGDYVYCAAADDKILPGFFERSMNLLQKYPSAGLCSALSLNIDEEGRNRGLHPSLIISSNETFIMPEKAKAIMEKAGLWIMGNTGILRRKVLIDNGGFIPELHSFSDGFLYHVIALTYGFCFIPEPLASWRRMDSGYAVSTGKNADLMKEIIRHAVRLMQTTYNDLFSKEYIKDFEKVQYFLMNLSLLSPMREKMVDPMERISLSFVMNIMFGIKRISYMLYLFIRFRPKVCPIITRKFNKYYHFLIFHASRKISVG